MTVAALVVVGLGPGDLGAVPESVRALLLDPRRTLLISTIEHPAASELAQRRAVESGDLIYRDAEDLDSVYRALADWVLDRATRERVVYAVPGSPLVGERSVALLREAARQRDIPLEVVDGRSFLDLCLDRLGLDPLAGGLQVLDGRMLPDPLLLHLPTIIGQVDTEAVLGRVKDTLGRVLAGETSVTLLRDLGSNSESVEEVALEELDRRSAGERLSLFVDPPPAGWWGLVVTVRRLRMECPWDARQTHHSLVRHLIEEAYEVADAIAELPAEAPEGPPDHQAYVDLEAELGDLLLQTVFHANLAREAGVFDVEEVAEGIRRKLVRRHPHVFAGAEVTGPEEVIRNWERLKQEEEARESLMDDVSKGLPALVRAAKVQRRAGSVGFDWPQAAPVVDKVAEELEELREVLEDREAAERELGDLLFAVVNLSRHLHVDPEMALRRATERFAARFRSMEASGNLDGLSLEELDARWQQAKERD